MTRPAPPPSFEGGRAVFPRLGSLRRFLGAGEALEGRKSKGNQMQLLRRAVLCGLMLIGGPALAAPDDVVLEVTDKVADAPVALTRADLAAMPEVTIETSTVVTDGVHSFTGVLMRELLEQVGATGETATAMALNGYIVDIPVSDFTDYDVILAYAMDGEAMTRDDKGPLWIVYPRDDHAALQDIRYDYRWAWQLYRLDLR